MAKRPTQTDVAKLAGVSTSTVSYLLSGNPTRRDGFPVATQIKVREAAKELGYTINGAARALRRRHSEIIGVVYVPPVTPWFDDFCSRGQNYLAEYNYNLVLLPFNPDQPHHVEGALSRGFLDGVIAVGQDVESEVLISDANKYSVPITVFSDSIPAEHTDVVNMHQREAVRDSVTYLWEKGRRDIAFLDSHHSASVNPMRTPTKREHGYLDGIRGLGLNERVIRCGETREAAYSTMSSVLNGPDAPEAIICYSDRGAISTIWAARKIGISVPEQLAVIGCGNTTEGRSMVPELTSLGNPVGGFGTIFDRLLQRIEEPKTPTASVSMPWELFIRDSA